MALAVVAGLWLLVFVPSWFKRSQDRERGILPSRPKIAKAKRSASPGRMPSVDNFVSLARDYAETIESEVSVSADPRAWQRTELPTPRFHEGTLESVQFADVVSMDAARAEVATRKLEQHELDEILRRRRANG